MCENLYLKIYGYADPSASFHPPLKMHTIGCRNIDGILTPFQRMSNIFLLGYQV